MNYLYPKITGTTTTTTRKTTTTTTSTTTKTTTSTTTKTTTTTASTRVVCQRINGFCDGSGDTYLLFDCDDDGIPDPFCSNQNGSQWAVQSSDSCMPSGSDVICRTGNGNVCPRTTNWCPQPDKTFQLIDCDGDGIPDPTCSDSEGNFWLKSSANGCQTMGPSAQCIA